VEYKQKIILVFVIVFIFSLNFPSHCFPQDSSSSGNKLEKAIWLYQHENYEEALVLFKELRTEEPQSASIAYYRGVTYKKLQNFLEAKPDLETAATLEPKVKEAIPELIDLLYQSEDMEGAKKWIAVAEKEAIAPAQTAFFKGLVLLKEGSAPDESIKAFEEAEKLDASLAQTVSYYKGLAYVQSKNFKEAKNVFNEIVVQQPATDLAEFANEYISILKRQEKAMRPFRGSVGYSLQYDDNVILKPNNEDLAAAASDKEDWRHVYTAQVEYNFKPVETFGTRASYSLYGAKQFDLDFYDTVSHDFALQPAFYAKKAVIGFPVHYNYVTVNDKRYLEIIGISNLNNVMIGNDKMVQLLLQYNIKDYAWTVTSEDNDRDSNEYLGSLGWFYFFGRNKEGFFNLRYAMNKEDAEGNNWKYLGNRLTASATVPIVKKVKWSVAGDYFRQDFSKRNTTYDKERHDDVFTVSNLVAYEVFDNFEFQLQHTFVNDAASIGIFKYKRNVYSIGAKYQF